MRIACLIKKEIKMKPSIQYQNSMDSQNKQQILNICFDAGSINKFSPGLKLLFSSDEPPMFVKVKRAETIFDNNTVTLY